MAVSLWEQAHWALMGVGCTWFLGDSTFLEVPWWIDSQSDGLKVGSRMALAASLAPISAGVCLLLRLCFPSRYYDAVVPVSFIFSLTAGYMLGCGLWAQTSVFIYISFFLSQCVGAMMPFGVLPWVMANDFKPALISSLYCGGSLASVSASVLAMVQSPGDDHRFTPSVFFLVASTPILASLFALCRIRSYRIGVISQPVEEAAEEETEACNSLPEPPSVRRSAARDAGGAVQAGTASQQVANLVANWRRWIGSATVLALVSSFMSTGSFVVLRSALPFATARVIPGHSACRPGCSAFCRAIPTAYDCHDIPACSWLGENATCIENRGADELQWATSTAQWAFAAGSWLTVPLPTMRIFFVPVLWLAPFGYVCTLALGGVGGSVFESKSSAVLLLCSVLAVRLFQGYFEVMMYRYVAHKYGEDAERVTIFLGIALMLLAALTGTATTLLVELNVFSD